MIEICPECGNYEWSIQVTEDCIQDDYHKIFEIE